MTCMEPTDGESNPDARHNSDLEEALAKIRAVAAAQHWESPELRNVQEIASSLAESIRRSPGFAQYQNRIELALDLNRRVTTSETWPSLAARIQAVADAVNVRPSQTSQEAFTDVMALTDTVTVELSKGTGQPVPEAHHALDRSQWPVVFAVFVALQQTLSSAMEDGEREAVSSAASLLWVLAFLIVVEALKRPKDED